jgi:hypothetical protein
MEKRVTTSDSKPKHLRFRYRFLIYFVIFILAAIYMVNNNAPTGSAPATVPNAARDMCINAIRTSVNNPSTLDIHMITGYAAQTSGDGITRMTQTFSAKNAFGLEKTFDAQCTIYPNGKMDFNVIEQGR